MRNFKRINGMEWQTENECAAALRGFSPKVANLSATLAGRANPGHIQRAEIVFSAMCLK
jgi:hypothetical protein